MAENTMKLEVITPERSFYTGDVTFVELNTTCLLYTSPSPRD